MTIEQQLIDEGEAVLFDSSNNTHTNEWDDHYIGVSTLVKQPAAKYAERILKQEGYEQRREDSFWGFLGNTLCDGAVSQVTQYRENRLEVAIPEHPGWTWAGHFDGLTVREGHIIMEEGKAYGRVDDHAAVELAFRQAILYSGLLYRTEQGTLPIAAFCNDDTAVPVDVDSLNRLGATWWARIWVFPRMGPSSITEDERPIKVREITGQYMDDIFDFYHRKTLAILKCLETGDLGPALEWDRSPEGLLEFEGMHRSTPPSVDAEHIMEAVKIQHGYKDAEDDVSMHKAEIKAYMRMNDLTEFTTPDGYKAKLVGKWENARSPYVKITPPKETT